MNNALTRFTSYFARKKTNKYAAVLLGMFAGFGFMSTASADSTWQTSNGNVAGNTVQFDWRGGTATYVLNVADGSTISVVVDNTIANCIGTCTPTPDEWRVSINNETFHGNTIGVFTVSTVASGQVVVSVYGKDIGFWGGWYGPIFQAPTVTSPVIIVDTPTATVETQTPQVVETPTVTVPDTPTVVPDTSTPVLDTQTSTVESQPATVPSDSLTVVPSDTLTVVETLTPVESATPVVETGTAPVETIPLPTQPPVVEPQPTPDVVIELPPAPQPRPEPVVPVVESLPEPETPSEPEVVQEDPVIETPVVEEPVVEEPVPVEDSEQVPVEEVQPDAQTEEEQNEPTPEPSPEPTVEPEPASQPDIAPEPPVSPQIVEASSVDLSTLAPDTPVLLDNGVVLTAEVVVALQLLENPAELLSELFTDPGQVLTAISNIGADMSPEVREKSEKVVVSAIIAGGVATQAASLAASATYRRNS